MNIKATKILFDLNEQLNFIDLEIDNQITRSENSIEIILKVLINLKNIISKFKFKSETEEIQFFKEIKRNADRKQSAKTHQGYGVFWQADVFSRREP
mgnify:CR=1 FL=1